MLAPPSRPTTTPSPLPRLHTQVYVVAHGPGSKSKIGSGKGRKGKVKYVDKRMIADSKGEKRSVKKGKQRRKKRNKKAAGKRKR